MMKVHLAHHALAFALILSVSISAFAEDWPAYRHDNQRGGITDESLKLPLAENWVFTPTFPPSHAWSDPQPKPVEKILELPRMRFDDAFHVAAAGDIVFFGSSSECKVYALDAATGAVRWEFFAEGPVRLAPAVAGGRVYFGADDGMVYCLNASDGKLIWSFAAAPSPERVLGNKRMISLWPVRTSVVVEGGVAYFGAGVFPAEGLYLFALDAASGKLLWKNDSYGQGGSGSVSPQGYLLLSKEKIFVPSGRTLPAAFNRADGKFLFHKSLNWRSSGLSGGTNISLSDDLLFCASEQLVGVSEATGALVAAEGMSAYSSKGGIQQAVVNKDMMYVLDGKEVAAFVRPTWMTRSKRMSKIMTQTTDLTKERDALKTQSATNKDADKQAKDIQSQLDKLAAERKAISTEGTKWQTPCASADALILAGQTLFAGGADTVTAFDAASGRSVWSAAVGGKARGLAVAGGRLLVSTDKGAIHCFSAGAASGQGRKVAPPVVADPFPKDAQTARCAETARQIIKESGATRGYALLLGSDGRLALELAKNTDLIIYMAVQDSAALASARKALTSAGVYGGKVTAVAQTQPGELPFADYFANLIVVEGDAAAAASAMPAKEILRMLKPCGGVAYIGQPPVEKSTPAPTDGKLQVWLDDFNKALNALGEKTAKIASNAAGVRITRGALNGAGSWTHEYGEPGNTACSDDQLVRGAIGILWFGEPGGEEMPSRHQSNSAPLALNGRMFIEGENVVMAYDSYNGTQLWERALPGALRVGLKTGCSNMVANNDGVFVATGETCLRLDPASGKTLMTYPLPPAKETDKKRQWDYLACVGGLLYGATGGDQIFAMDIETNKGRWIHTGKNIMPATICIGGGRVFFVDREVTPEQQEKCLATVPPETRVDAKGKKIAPDVRLVVALNAETGKKSWERPQYVSDCVKIGAPGGELTAMYSNKVLLLCAQPWNGHFWKEFLAGEFSRRSLIALAEDDGHTLWSGRKGYRSRPLIVGDRVIAEPWSYDLQTGYDTMRPNPVTGADARWQMSRPGHHCGNMAAAPNALFFRSYVTASYDLLGDYGTAHFGAQRPGCWINCIPANGLVIMPEASSGCVCPFSLQCSIVFQPRKVSRVWGAFSAPGPLVPVKRLGVNFGAPGDRKDAQGNLWLGYPRPTGVERLVMNFKLDTKVDKEGGYFCKDANFLKFEGAQEPWLFASGCRGLTQCVIPVNTKDAAPSSYTVRLLFAEIENQKPGQRVFDVLLQDRPVLKNFDIAKESGGPMKALVKEFKGITAQENLTLELASKAEALTSANMPIISALEIISETAKP
ncbi:MAG: PQQ-binding-like beta-propeller repeat protein [Candidatus Sumerlaeota bacterium]|nr:PQQ-binding-like beta-propeller repeat protein [Candidatus Sumerlaeota bacterium]